MLRRFIIILVLVPTLLHAGDDVQYWSFATLKIAQMSHTQLAAHGQARFVNDSSELGLMLIGLKSTTRLTSYLDAGLNYSRLNVKKKFGWEYQNRYELELNPFYNFKNGISLQNRNRFEYREIEHLGSDHDRLRNRIQASFKGFYTNAEIFIDLETHVHSENRIVPLGYKVFSQNWVRIDVFYLLQSQNKTTHWITNQVLGTHLMLNFN